MGNERVIEEKCLTNELDIGVDNDNCEDMPNVIRFNEDDAMTKDFNFNIGMEKNFTDGVQRDFIRG